MQIARPRRGGPRHNFPRHVSKHLEERAVRHLGIGTVAIESGSKLSFAAMAHRPLPSAPKSTDGSIAKGLTLRCPLLAVALPRTVAVRTKGTSEARPVAAQRATRRERALAMVRKLHRDIEAVRGGRSLIMWCPVQIVVKRRADLRVLAFAVARGWIELSPGARSVRVTAEGWQVVQ